MKPLASGFLTSEFWVALAALAGKVVVLLLTLNVIRTSDPNALTQTVTEVVLGVGTIWGLTHTAAKYSDNRTQLKTAALKAAPQSSYVDLRTR